MQCGLPIIVEGESMNRNKQKSMSVPNEMKEIYASITKRTDEFCRQHLSEEYAELSHALTAALCRKRPSPLTRGKQDIWAAAIVYAIGRVNFLGDKTQEVYMKTEEFCRLFEVTQSSLSAKTIQIWKLMKMSQMDPSWTLPSKLKDNLMAWLISVNGYLVDARYAPREIQEEAYRLGLIPFLP
jgi:hypothetical protein